MKEDSGGITVRQDRFLETGKPEPSENETIWYTYDIVLLLHLKADAPVILRHVPLFLTTVDSSGATVMDTSKLLKEREGRFELDLSKPFLIKGGSRGVCTFDCLSH